MIQAKNSLKCKINTPQKIKAKLNASIIYVEPDLEELEVMPGREEQHFVSEKDGYSSVTVKGDENLVPNYIAKGKKIFDVMGELEAVDTSDATATPEDIRKDKTAYVDGEKVVGTLEIKEVTKGLVINAYDDEGYPTDIAIVGMTEIPERYFYNLGSGENWFSKYSNITLPEGIISIGKEAFSGCSYMTGLKKLPSSLKQIGDRAFNNCGRMILTELPSELITIGSYSFYSCSALALTELPEGITSIGDYAFYGCNELTLTQLPEGIKSIGNYVFYSCRNLSLTELPEGLTSIGNYAFRDCINITLTKLPEGITSIGEHALQNCTNIDLKVIPSGIKEINTYAFFGCKMLSKITCLGAIKKISTYAFNGCTNLQKFVMPNITSVPTLSSTNAFTGTPIANGTGYMYFPDYLVESFKTATNWSTYANQIKGVSELV